MQLASLAFKVLVVGLEVTMCWVVLTVAALQRHKNRAKPEYFRLVMRDSSVMYSGLPRAVRGSL